MPTIVESLQDATAELRAAALAMQQIRNAVAAQLAATTGQATTIIQNFVDRPPIIQVFVDPDAGSDANDGSTPDLARRSIDAALDDIGTTGTTLALLGDVTIRRRRNIYAPLSFTGVQRAANPAGFIPYRRTISMLATAENSPSGGRTFCAGAWLLSTVMSASLVNFSLPDQPIQDFRAHFTSDTGTNIVFLSMGLQVASSGAGSLLGSTSNPIDVHLAELVLGPSAAGHLFEGIAAGDNPNAAYRYRTNITSA